MKILYSLILALLLLTNNRIVSASDTTFILVHGAWHGEWTWFQLEYELRKSGYDVVTVNLPAHGLDTTSPTQVQLSDYATKITNSIDTITGEIILAGHSMGGIAISAAAELRPQKISKLVYIAAFMPQSGQSMLDIALTDTNSMILPNIIIDTVNNTVDLQNEGIEDIFYSQSSEAYIILSKKLLTREPLLPLVTPLSLSDTAYGSIPRFYVTTTYDRAISPEIQEQMYTALPCEEVYEIHTEHSPFFSNPVLLKNKLRNIARYNLQMPEQSEFTFIEYY